MDGRMESGRANPLTLRKNRYKNKPNLALGGQFWYQNPPFKEITVKEKLGFRAIGRKVNDAEDASFQLREAQSTYGDGCVNIDLTFRWDI